MNLLPKIGCRIVQFCFHAALPLLPYREPEQLKQIGDMIPVLLKSKIHSILLVTDKGLRNSGATRDLEHQLYINGITAIIYDKTCANPTVQNAEEAKTLYLQNQCQAIIAFGGGSSIDCAKCTGALVAYPKKKVSQLKGILRVWRRLPMFFAIPTTAGTGSEVTLTAVITDSEKKHKYTMNSFPLIPHYAVLDPNVTRSLPPHLTATTGMDALTHAIEAYIGNSTTCETRKLSLEAVHMIFKYLPAAYQDGNNMEAREHMLLAAYKAGIAFSKSYVGYIHAVAHSLGGQYNIPHGLANAVLLPIILEEYGSCIHIKLHELSIAAGVASADDTPEIGAQKLIQAIRQLNTDMGIETCFQQIKEEDIPTMARHAATEANPLYPVPKLLNHKELMHFYELASEQRPDHATASANAFHRTTNYNHKENIHGKNTHHHRLSF